MAGFQDVLTSTLGRFGDRSQSQLFWEEDERQGTPVNEEWLQLHYASHINPETFVTYGSLLKMYSNQKETTTEFLFFNDTNTQRISKARIANVTVSAIPTMRNMDNQQRVLTAKVDYALGTVTFPERLTGVVKVTYDYYYDLYKYTFSGGSCPTATPDVSPFTPAVAVAVDRDDTDIRDFYNLEGPLCGENQGLPKQDELEDLIVVEKKKGSNLILTGANSIFDVVVYPWTIATVTHPGGKSLRKAGAPYHVEVTEDLSFEGNGIVLTKYPPYTSLRVTKTTEFSDAFGRTFNPTFRKEGNTILLSENTGRNSYNLTGYKQLANHEIAATTPSGRAVPCYGTVQVTYKTTYAIFSVTAVNTTTPKGLRTFGPTPVTANDAFRSLTVIIDPLSTEGTR